MAEISILLVDDHEVVRKGLHNYLETVPGLTILGEAGSGEEAIAMVQEQIPDVVLLDLIMPGIDGVDATRQIKKISPRTQVVILTSFHDDSHIFRALKAGATSYVLKDMRMERLAGVLLKAAQGEVVLHPRIAARVLETLREDSHRGPQLYDDLTERELEVLRMISSGLTNSQIAEKLGLSEHTVKGHVRNILSKLQLVDRTQAVVFAWQSGLVRRE
jgi:two-component system, NarL family, response regulator LiaR